MTNEHQSAPKSSVMTVAFSNGDSETLMLAPVARNTFRLEESSLFGDLRYGDVIEASTQPDETLRFISVLTHSPLHTTTFVISKQLETSESFRNLLAKVMAVGGMWERVFGGVVILHFPSSAADAIKQEIDTVTGSA